MEETCLAAGPEEVRACAGTVVIMRAEQNNNLHWQPGQSRCCIIIFILLLPFLLLLILLLLLEQGGSITSSPSPTHTSTIPHFQGSQCEKNWTTVLTGVTHLRCNLWSFARWNTTTAGVLTSGTQQSMFWTWSCGALEYRKWSRWRAVLQQTGQDPRLKFPHAKKIPTIPVCFYFHTFFYIAHSGGADLPCLC